jgi:YVTN family beta-propeller protein
VSSVIDTTSQTVSATITVGSGADFVAFSPDSTRAYVTHYGGNSVAVIDTSSNSVIANITVGSGSYAVAVSPDGSKAYVTNEFSGTVSVIDSSSNSVIDTVNVGDYPTGIAVSPDGSPVYASNFNSNTVSVIDTATNFVIATINVGGGPEGVVFSPDGSHAYVRAPSPTVRSRCARGRCLLRGRKPSRGIQRKRPEDGHMRPQNLPLASHFPRARWVAACPEIAWTDSPAPANGIGRWAPLGEKARKGESTAAIITPTITSGVRVPAHHKRKPSVFFFE